MWEALNNNVTARDTIIHNIDEDDERGTWQVCDWGCQIWKITLILKATISKDQYKLIWGQEYLLKKPQKQQSRKVQLYDVFQDPSENNNLAEEFPDLVWSLQEEILAAKNKSLALADYPKGK